MPTSRARSSQIEVASGREIAIAQYGDLKSKRVLFWFHGTPGGRHQIPPASIGAASESGVRIITMDRPGIGQGARSDMRRSRHGPAILLRLPMR